MKTSQQWTGCGNGSPGLWELMPNEVSWRTLGLRAQALGPTPLRIPTGRPGSPERPLARRLLYNVSPVARDIAGTHEIRRRARSNAKSYCIGYGLPTFITWTADESQNAMFLRLLRLREADPAITKGSPEMRRWARRLEPPFTSWDTRDASDSIEAFPCAIHW